jgi:uncharacterized protein (TIGR02147 family)
MRAFSRKLGISSAALSEILSGKRQVSRKLAERISNRLMLSPVESNRVLKLFEQPAAGTDTRDVTLDAEHYSLISDWYHFGILSLAETAAFQSDLAEIARRLGITNGTARQAVDRLVRLNLLKRDGDELRPTGHQYHTSDGIKSQALRRAHANNLELARRSLEEDPVGDRDFSSMTMAIDPEKLPKAREMLREFRERLSAFLEGGEKKKVYKVCMQLMPLSDREVENG